MAKVLGLGGLFFKADDPKAVGDWYARVLGFEVADWGGVAFPQPARGYQVWSPFAAETDYFAPSSLPVMVNLMVDDLDGVLARARADPSGRFAWILDPVGLKIELWEPSRDAPPS